MNLDFGLIGPALAMGLAMMGCCIGCWIAGEASHAAMTRTEEGHGKYIGMACAPSSQSLYGFVLMYLMTGAIKAGTLAPISGIGIGIAAGMAFMFSAIFQGRVCATGIQASVKSPAVFGKCFVAIGVIESFALFAFVVSILVM